MLKINFTHKLYSLCSKSVFCIYLVDWDRTLVGYALLGNGSTEVRPPVAFVEGRMIAFATSLVLVARRTSFKKRRNPFSRPFMFGEIFFRYIMPQEAPWDDIPPQSLLQFKFLNGIVKLIS